jgi:type I restriction enzyme R subunit
MYFDHNGRPITVSLKDYTRQQILGQYSSLENFLTCWNQANQKAAIIHELSEQGVLVEDLQKAVNRELDVFDIICHVAFDQPPLTRKERANNVKKRNYFTKYGDAARKVLEALLDKYSEQGVENLESMEVLKVQPFDQFGSPYEIVNLFGSKQNYLAAIRELEQAIYQEAA